MYIPNGVTQKYPFCRIQLMIKTFVHSTKFDPTNQNLIKRIRKRYDKTLGTSVINIQMSPLYV